MALLSMSRSILDSIDQANHDAFTHTLQIRSEKMAAAAAPAASGDFDIHIRYPSGHIYTAHVSGSVRISLIKEFVRARDGYPIDLQRLIYAGRELDDDTKTVAECGIMKETTLTMHLMQRLFHGPKNCKWKPFIKSTSIARFSTNHSLRPQLQIWFRSEVDGKSINLDLLSDMGVRFGNMANQWHACIAFAKNMVAVDVNQSYFWCRTGNGQRVKVLKLRREFSQLDPANMLIALDKERYDVDGINAGYFGGDVRSWQRYTTDTPIDGRITTSDLTNSIAFQPRWRLEPDTWYALVLLHNNHTFNDCIYEDWLIPFKTRPDSVDPLPVAPQLDYTRPSPIKREVIDVEMEEEQAGEPNTMFAELWGKDVSFQAKPRESPPPPPPAAAAAAAASSSIQAKPTCVVCLDAPSAMLFLPCSHIVCCATCAPQLDGDLCPACRAKIEKRQAVFFG